MNSDFINLKYSHDIFNEFKFVLWAFEVHKIDNNLIFSLGLHSGSTGEVGEFLPYPVKTTGQICPAGGIETVQTYRIFSNKNLTNAWNEQTRFPS